jgi:hypothetical protein
VKARARLETLQRVLGEVSAFGFVASAVVGPELNVKGYADDIWRVATLSAITGALAILQGTGTRRARAAVLYEEKSLRTEYRREFEAAIREVLPGLGRDSEVVAATGVEPMRLSVIRIDQVSKPASGLPDDYRQSGTRLAHHVCAEASRLHVGADRRIWVHDHSTEVAQMVALIRDSRVKG